MMENKKEWTGKTYGNNWMHKWLIKSLSIINVKLLYAFSALFVVPVCLILNPSCGIMYRFYRKRFNYTPLHSSLMTYKNHCAFSEIVIDRFAMYAGKKFNIEIEGYELFLNLAEQPKGFIQLSSHVGNYELAGYSLVAKTKIFNALVFGGEKQSIMDNRNKMFSGANIRMIPIKQDMSHLFEIQNALNLGEIVSMPADRIYGSTKSVKHIFFGSEALFPLGPFKTIALNQLDALAVNVMKVDKSSYKIYIKQLPYDKSASGKEQIYQISKAYVNELENIVKKYPAQWYNYFESQEQI